MQAQGLGFFESEKNEEFCYVEWYNTSSVLYKVEKRPRASEAGPFTSMVSL